MLRTNLATRPFYNERAIYLILGVVAVAGVVALLASVLQLMDLTRRNRELAARADETARSMDELTARTSAVQRKVSDDELTVVADATREANTLIDQRVFSWTGFFNRIETTLPADVMMTEVRPDIAPGSVEVTMGVLGRRLDDIRDFVMALEESGAFEQVLNRQVELTEDGMYQAVLRGRYLELTSPSFEGAVASLDAIDKSETKNTDTPNDKRRSVVTARDDGSVPGDADMASDEDSTLETPAVPVDVASDAGARITQDAR